MAQIPQGRPETLRVFLGGVASVLLGTLAGLTLFSFFMLFQFLALASAIVTLAAWSRVPRPRPSLARAGAAMAVLVLFAMVLGLLWLVLPVYRIFR